MANKWFSPPVGVWLGKTGTVQYRITNIEQMARILLEEWPTEPGPAHRKAREMALSCLEGKCDALEAREAFVEAAREANILAE
ncbi:DUF982 domain-containing protein [Chelativorans oligotrophicus]|uniref:DUF982 domain-containing protein n=1 Tax=Chelativorans oligotrophicus TaxID=449974 RepID=UPI00140A5ED5|nr:DUF982 domain-containing protein [Chelativorans oligotrophicus]